MANHRTDRPTHETRRTPERSPERTPERSPERTPERRDRLRSGLGWLSLALAGPPLAAPDAFCEAIGVGSGPRQRIAARLVGLRELAAAGGLLGLHSRVWLWGRVAGDAMDLTLLGRLRSHDGRGISRTIAATAGVVGITAVDLYAAVTRTHTENVMKLTATTTVNRPPTEVYEFWRNLENLPTFMAHVEDVRTGGDDRSHWVVSAPFGRRVEWDATMTEEVPGRRIAWRSIQNADVKNVGEVEFVPAPGHRGTEVHVRIVYEMPAGKLGEAIARYFGEDPHQQLDDDLRRLKQLLELGEVVRSEGAPSGKRARREFPQHPARPLTDEEYATEVLA
jgi:uncharacterized membrane protein